MSDLITDWQQALIDLLSSEPPDGVGIEFRAMRRDGHSTERDLGCVFPAEPSIQAMNSGRSIFATYHMLVRCWLRFKGEPSQDVQPDPSPVNELGVNILNCLQPVQVGLLDDLYFYATSTRHDYRDRGVEITLVGYGFNPASLPVPS